MGAGSSCCCHRNTEEEERSHSSRDVMDFRRSFRLGKAVRMPGKTGFCWCFGGTAPPEISYGIENGGMTLKPIEVEIPMPQDEEELNAKFAELVDELDLDKPHRDAMFNLPPEKKWQIYCSKKKEQEDPNSASWPDYYIERVNTMSCVFFAHDEEEIQTRAKLVDSLKTALRTQPMSFVIRFIELEGLQSLVNFLANMDYTTAHSPIHTSVIGCIKALMNNSQGRAHVLAHPTCIDIIAQSLATDNLKAEVAVLEMLGAVCLVPGGHKKVLHAMCHYQKYAGERTRFQTLINDLDRDTGIYKEEVNLKTAIMSFINAALKYGPGQNHLEFRLHLRYEFLMLGLQPIIEKLRSTDNPTLERHLDFFEMVRNEDERELAKKFESSHIDTKSATAMFELLRKKLHFSVAYPHLLSLLFHLLQLPFGNSSAQHWQLIDRIVQQVTLQTKEGDPDVEPLELDVKKIVKQLANENEIKAVQTKMKEIQKENDELLSKLTKKERECEAKATEKEELISTMNKMKGKLEEEKERHLQTKLQLEELTVMVNNLQQLIECERAERMKLEHAVKTGSLPDDAKAGFASAAAFAATTSMVNSCIPPPPPPFGSVPPPPPPPMIGGGPPPPPPPPGFMGGPPPPPCPGGMPNGLFSGVPGLAVRTKNTPKSKNALKSFNWSKLPENKIKGTVWTEIDDAKIYSNLDLEEFEKTFSAYQRQDTGSHSKLFSEDNKPKELSVVDGRRAQNCTILLSKLKMTNQELSKAIMNMDEQEELPKDMCEQLLKFVPTPEETQLLSEHEADIDSMAKADRFLFEMSRVEHYEQRLRALYFKKKFSERLSECKPKVDAVLEASKEVQKCRYLKKVLELVLALGNYMNRGARGNASGFKIGSLNKIIDTKSSIDKRITLLHYMLETICKKFPEMLKLENEMPNVRKAAKVNMTELDAEVGVLRVGLKDIEKELTYFQKKAIGDGRKDKFVSVMSDFVTVAAYNFSELEEQVTEMKQRYEKVANTFGEDPKKSQPDEFFGVFDMFLTSFTDARLENERLKRIKEEEEKRTRMEEKLRAEKEKQRRMSNGRGGKEKGEFDDLISALRTGDVFTEDMAKLKRTQRRRVSKDAVSGPNIRERSGYKAS